MGEAKTEQKNWRFRPQILSELSALCHKEVRSEQNMVEVLIHRAYEQNFPQTDQPEESGIAVVKA